MTEIGKNEKRKMEGSKNNHSHMYRNYGAKEEISRKKRLKNRRKRSNSQICTCIQRDVSM